VRVYDAWRRRGPPARLVAGDENRQEAPHPTCRHGPAEDLGVPRVLDRRAPVTGADGSAAAVADVQQVAHDRRACEGEAAGEQPKGAVAHSASTASIEGRRPSGASVVSDTSSSRPPVRPTWNDGVPG